MITCPWCGTNYLTFQPNCKNCGGPLQPASSEIPPADPSEALHAPPLAPRPISDRYAWRLLFSDGWWIAALVFGIIGVVFSLVGAGLSLGRITAFIGIPFLILGLGFLGAAAWVFLWRYQKARKIVSVLREGDATRGQIVEVRQDYSVRVNGRSPWVIRYQFQANGQAYESTVRTFNQPGEQLQAGKAAYVLYLPSAPNWSSIYPHP